MGRGVLIEYQTKVGHATAKIDVDLTALKWTPRIFESAACNTLFSKVPIQIFDNLAAFFSMPLMLVLFAITLALGR